MPDSSECHQDAILPLFNKMRKKFENQQAIQKDDAEKILFVGDVHGDLETINIVNELLPKYERVVFLGDFVDRGKEDTKVAINVAKTYLENDKVVIIAGNHDACTQVHPQDWNGRLERQFGPDSFCIRDAYRRAFEKAPIAYYNENYQLLAVHGFIPSEKEKWDLTKWERGDDFLEVLWNDPNFNEKGIHLNPRGGGLKTIGFDVVDAFMNENNLKYIVRSHQPSINEMFDIADDKKLVNIGSAIYYGERGFFTLPEEKIFYKMTDDSSKLKDCCLDDFLGKG